MKNSFFISATIFFVFSLQGQGAFAQNLNLTLSDQLTYPGQSLSNIAGWTDPQDGKEYALVGAQNGLSVVDVSNPASVFEVVQISGPSSSWREIKTNGNYAYVTTENGAIGLQIVDLINLPATNLTTATWTPTISSQQLATVHALHIDNGKVYLYGSNISGQGAVIADIATNPMAPVYLGRYDNNGYIHDGYVRGDTLYASHIYAGTCAVVNLTNPASGVSLAQFPTPGNFTHNTWLSADSKTVFTTDEVSNSYLASFDLTNLGNISELDRIQSNPGSNSVVHNTHIISVGGGEYAVTSWYKDGVVITDVTRPNNMVQTGNYDTYTQGSGSGMNGCWGVYPYLPSGTIVASDIVNGLFVFSPNYVRACYIEGTVVDCNTLLPISGATVTVQSPGPYSNSATDLTDAQGNYAVGVVNAATYTVTFAKSGYTTQTLSISVTNGNVTLQNVQLCGPTPPFTYTGTVCDVITTAGISNANVRIQDASNTWDTITDASGNFTISNMVAGSYEVIAGKWGYTTSCTQNQNIAPTSPPLNICLYSGIYDDFTWDWGWTESGTAAAGNWERGSPNGTTCSGNPANPGVDDANDCSVEAYVTGNQGVSCFDDDVDGGYTDLTSPVFDLTSYINPWLFYSRWHYLTGNPQNDSLVITLSNGTSSVLIEGLNNSAPNSSMWVNSAFDLTGMITFTSNMTVRIRAREAASGHTVECGFDYFHIVDSATVVGTNEPALPFEVKVFPNPSNGTATLRITNLPESTNYELKIFNVLGEKVYSATLNSKLGTLNLSEAPNGIYFIAIKTEYGTVAKKLILNKYTQ